MFVINSVYVADRNAYHRDVAVTTANSVTPSRLALSKSTLFDPHSHDDDLLYSSHARTVATSRASTTTPTRPANTTTRR
jgi:hypothetical protein